MPKKLLNPDPSAIPLRFVMEQFNEAHVLIPAHGFVVVSDQVAAVVQALYSTLEVVQATEEEYLAFREAREREAEAKKLAELEAAKAAKVAEKQRVEDEKKRAKKLNARAAEEKARQKEALAKALDEEKASQARVAATTARVVANDKLPAALQPEVKVTEPLGVARPRGRPRKAKDGNA